MTGNPIVAALIGFSLPIIGVGGVAYVVASKESRTAYKRRLSKRGGLSAALTMLAVGSVGVVALFAGRGLPTSPIPYMLFSIGAMCVVGADFLVVRWWARRKYPDEWRALMAGEKSADDMPNHLQTLMVASFLTLSLPLLLLALVSIRSWNP